MNLIPQNIYCASITDWLSDGINDFVEGAFKLFKGVLKMVFDLLGANPTTGTYKSAWSTVTNLYDIFSVIGYSLVVVFFLYGFLRDTVDIRQELHLESIIKLFIRFIITINVMNVFITYIPKFCSWAINMLDATKSTFKFDTGKVVSQLDAQYNTLVMFFIAILMWIVCLACSVIVIYTCFGRFVNFYLLIPFGSIAISTIAGGGQLSQTGFSYIKSLLVYTFEIVAMGVVLAITGAFLSGSVIVNAKSGGNWLLLEVVVKMITITAALKGADATLKKAFNM